VRDAVDVAKLNSRLPGRFEALAREGRAALVTFITAGDPDLDTCREVLLGLPEAGADVIELGMPFTDPMADGPAIQRGGMRAIKAGMTVAGTLALTREFRARDQKTPIVLMGYFNPIYSYGVDRFLDDAIAAGVDGLIIVDLPAEEDNELCRPALDRGLPFIRLIPPTADDRRLPVVLRNTAGFVYYVAITGITGAGSATEETIVAAVERLKRHTDLPVAVGFGVKGPEQAATIARTADAVVVGSAIVDRIGAIAEGGETVESVLDFVRSLSGGVRHARAQIEA